MNKDANYLQDMVTHTEQQKEDDIKWISFLIQIYSCFTMRAELVSSLNYATYAKCKLSYQVIRETRESCMSREIYKQRHFTILVNIYILTQPHTHTHTLNTFQKYFFLFILFCLFHIFEPQRPSNVISKSSKPQP